jgi:hypothetical protein
MTILSEHSGPHLMSAGVSSTWAAGAAAASFAGFTGVCALANIAVAPARQSTEMRLFSSSM